MADTFIMVGARANRWLWFLQGPWLLGYSRFPFVYTAVGAGNVSQASSMEMHHWRGLLQVSTLVQASGREDKACFGPQGDEAVGTPSFLWLPSLLLGMYTAVEAGN